MENKFFQDYQAAYPDNKGGMVRILRTIMNSHMRYIWLGRVEETIVPGCLKTFVKRWRRGLGRRYGLEMEFNGRIDGGMVLSHPFGITVNAAAYLGRNVTLFKGCTIGSVRSGRRRGVPRIGSRVVVGCNAFVCGGITIGDDVLIAANAFVDFDVPSNSLVIGNPGRIFPKENPSADYLYKEGR